MCNSKASVQCAALIAPYAGYELIEWAAAEMMGQGADAFLGAQGYAWDTQSDMLTALFGAISAQLMLGKLQDVQLEQGRNKLAPAGK